MTDEVWSVWERWNDLREVGEMTLVADEPACVRIARFLDLEGLRDLKATLAHAPWRDGVKIEGRVEAIAMRLCGVSLEAFEERIDTPLLLRLVPEGSVNAPAPEAELVVTLDGDDPPEVVDGDRLDIASYVVESLGLALEPFPRKPGAAFEYVDPSGPVSPFAVLKFPKP